MAAQAPELPAGREPMSERWCYFCGRKGKPTRGSSRGRKSSAVQLSRKALRVGTGYDASYRPFQCDVAEPADAPITVEHIQRCGRAVAMNRNIHKHGQSCRKSKRGCQGCRFTW